MKPPYTVLILSLTACDMPIDEPQIHSEANNERHTSSDWRYATSREVIGLNPEFVEARIGVAKSKESWDEETLYLFEIDGCEVEYSVSADTIDSLSIYLTPECVTEFTGFTDLSDIDFSETTTFGPITSSLTGEWRASCLGSCGNAADPSLYYFHQGPHSNEFIDIVLEATVDNEKTLTASDNWQRELEQLAGVGEYGFIPERYYGCGGIGQNRIGQWMTSAKIERITVGFGVNPTDHIAC